MRQTLKAILLITWVIFFCVSCFKEDEKLYPPLPGDATVYSFKNSIYDFQSYFDFSSDSCTSATANDTWHIEFATADTGWVVRVNSAALYQAYPTGDTAFYGITPVSNVLKYIFDSSGGDPDSTAFAGWLDRSKSPAVPTGEVFLVGKYDGIKVSPKWKLRIDKVDNEYFWFTWATFPSGTPVSVQLPKDKTVSYLQYSFSLKDIVKNEPPRNEYDLLFTQYGSILFDNLGVPTPYFVRGIYLNPFNVEASLDTLHTFEEVTYELVKDLEFSARQDVIGYEWKDVKVDQNTNTAEYFVDPDLVWIIRDTEGFLYKMKFIEFYNSNAEVGYTTIEYQRL